MAGQQLAPSCAHECAAPKTGFRVYAMLVRALEFVNLRVGVAPMESENLDADQADFNSCLHCRSYSLE